jgi:hypothetical protein
VLEENLLHVKTLLFLQHSNVALEVSSGPSGQECRMNYTFNPQGAVSMNLTAEGAILTYFGGSKSLCWYFTNNLYFGLEIIIPTFIPDENTAQGLHLRIAITVESVIFKRP